MSNLFTQLNQEAQKQKQALNKSSGQKQIDTKSDSDATASRKDAVASPIDISGSHKLDKQLLVEVIQELSQAPTLNSAISLRLNADEKEFIEDFILVTLRREKLQGHQVSIAKLMRYALSYLLLKHREEFVDLLKTALKPDDSRSIFK